MSTEIDRWYVAKQHPLEPAIRRVVEIFRGADPRITAYVKYGNLCMGYVGDFASFVQIAEKRRLNLMFHRGAALGDFPGFEGDGHSACFLRFASLDEVDASAGVLRDIAVAWCELMVAESARTRPAAKKPAAKKPVAARRPTAKKPAAARRPAKQPAAKAKQKKR